MASIRSQSDAIDLPADLRLRVRVVLGRATAMGLIEPASTEATNATDGQLWEALRKVAAKAGQSGVGFLAGSYFQSTDIGPGLDTDLVRTVLDQLVDALEGSPMPSHEIPELIRVLGWPLLVRLTGSAEVSLRRYANDKRVPPDDLANRIHWLALVVADLRGGYNDFGVRRWIERPRTQLGGRSPLDVLEGDWSPQTSSVQRVKDLAAWVAQPTAAT